MSVWRDPQLERELCVEGLDPGAAQRSFSHLSRYLKAPLPEIAAAYWRQKKESDPQAQREAVGAKNAEALDRYYTETPQYLYELSYWEATRDKQKWFEVLAMACRKRGLRRVLDFGGRVGGLTLALRRRGILCDHLDVDGNTLRYASWRFREEMLPVTVWRADRELPARFYDAAFAWDVFEHLFDLERTLEKIAAALRTGGWLASKSTFSESEQHHIHLEKNRIYENIRLWNRLLEGKGFVFVGQLKPDPLFRFFEKAIGWHRPFDAWIIPRLKHGGNFLIHEKRGGADARS